MEHGASASVKSIQIRASVVCADMVLGLAAQIPVAHIDYIEMVIGDAFLDWLNQYFRILDTVVFLDAPFLAVGTGFADVVEFADALDLQADYSRHFADAAAFAETIGIKGEIEAGVFKSVKESVAFADSGVLASQGYADPSYFAGAYVGAYVTF